MSNTLAKGHTLCVHQPFGEWLEVSAIAAIKGAKIFGSVN